MVTAATTPAPPVTGDYPAQFRRYIHWGVEHLLQKVPAQAARLPDALREEAWTLLSFALGVSEAWPATRGLLLALTPHMEQGGWWGEWIPYLERGIHHSESAAEAATAAELWLQLGVLHRSLANYDQARTCLQISVERYAALRDGRNQARALNRLAFLARLTDRPQEAEQITRAALALLNDHDSERATSYAILGAVAFDQRDWQLAIHHYQQALQLAETQNNLRMKVWLYEDLGCAFCAQGNFAAAIDAVEHALDLLGPLHAPTQEAAIRLNLGAIYLSNNQPEQAIATFAKAELTLRTVGDERKLALLNSNLGIAYRYLGQWEAAKQALTTSVEQAKRIGYFELVANSLDELGLLWLETQGYDQARQCFVQALGWLPKISNQPAQAHLRQLISEHFQQLEKQVSKDDPDNFTNHQGHSNSG